MRRVFGEVDFQVDPGFRRGTRPRCRQSRSRREAPAASNCPLKDGYRESVSCQKPLWDHLLTIPRI
jgi:hypothetical protein